MSLGKFYLEKYQFSRGNSVQILIFGLDLVDFWPRINYWPTTCGLDLVVLPPTSDYWPTRASHLGWRHPSPGGLRFAMPSPTLCGLPFSFITFLHFSQVFWFLYYGSSNSAAFVTFFIFYTTCFFSKRCAVSDDCQSQNFAPPCRFDVPTIRHQT